MALPMLAYMENMGKAGEVVPPELVVSPTRGPTIREATAEYRRTRAVLQGDLFLTKVRVGTPAYVLDAILQAVAVDRMTKQVTYRAVIGRDGYVVKKVTVTSKYEDTPIPLRRSDFYLGGDLRVDINNRIGSAQILPDDQLASELFKDRSGQP
jgi:hypothetical protein